MPQRLIDVFLGLVLLLDFSEHHLVLLRFSSHSLLAERVKRYGIAFIGITLTSLSRCMSGSLK